MSKVNSSMTRVDTGENKLYQPSLTSKLSTSMPKYRQNFAMNDEVLHVINNKNLHLSRIRNKRTVLELNPFKDRENTTDEYSNPLTMRRKIKKTLIRRLGPIQEKQTNQMLTINNNGPHRWHVVVRKRKPIVNSTELYALESDLVPELLLSMLSPTSLNIRNSSLKTSSGYHIIPSQEEKTIKNSITLLKMPNNETVFSSKRQEALLPTSLPIRMGRRCNLRKCSRLEVKKKTLKAKLQQQPSKTQITLQSASKETITVIETSTLKETSLSVETIIAPKTYTYIVERVHENEHQIQSSSLVRYKTQMITHTIFKTNTILLTNTQLIKPTKYDLLDQMF
ncbi:uncharacterized protein LOC129953172 [Eupeodes corollae]|uniref:uncharacterized protein LOC129953172 n=1 Tax=Eupeodes corollae TaxID=290404 RepID=UPI0024929F16|nr:uncharacterized protein LOC129953172 [Eupeodes corollae]